METAALDPVARDSTGLGPYGDRLDADFCDGLDGAYLLGEGLWGRLGPGMVLSCGESTSGEARKRIDRYSFLLTDYALSAFASELRC